MATFILAVICRPSNCGKTNVLMNPIGKSVWRTIRERVLEIVATVEISD